MVCLRLVGPYRHNNASIGESIARWDLRVVDEEYCVLLLGEVPYTLRQPSNVAGESCGPGAFIGSAYKLCVTLVYSCGGVKYPLEGYGAFPYGLHCMVVLCA